MAPATLLSLPNEVLIPVLTPFSTSDLLHFALVSTRFHDLVLRILHHRLALAASLKEHKIIFEGFHPGHKNIEPYLFCDYLGTPGLSTSEDSRLDPVYFDHDGKTGFGRLGSLYSWFRPVPPEEKARLRRPHPASQTVELQDHRAAGFRPFGDGRVLSNEPREQGADGEGADTQPLAAYIVSLDPDEGFTQMTMVANLVKLGPRRGLFEHIVNVSDSTVRLKRDWMQQVAASTYNVETGVANEEEESLRTLWVDDAQNIGMKVRMAQRSIRHVEAPVLFRETDPAVSYTMKYDVLLIRTTRLLLAVEEALLQDNNDLASSTGSLNSLRVDEEGIWAVAEDMAADSVERSFTIEDRIAHLSRLLLARDGLVRSKDG